MQVSLNVSAESTDTKVLERIPGGKIVKELELVRALGRLKGGLPIDTKASLQRLLAQRKIAVINVPGDIMSLAPSIRYYFRPFRVFPIRDQRGLKKNDPTVAALIKIEGDYIMPVTLFAHPTMPAYWQQETVLLKGGIVQIRGSFAAVADHYKNSIKSGGGRMVIHRIGTPLERDPNKLLKAFRAAQNFRK